MLKSPYVMSCPTLEQRQPQEHPALQFAGSLPPLRPGHAPAHSFTTGNLFSSWDVWSVTGNANLGHPYADVTRTSASVTPQLPPHIHETLEPLMNWAL